MSKYSEDYFLRGQEKGLSLYTNYRWLPDLTIPMAKAIADKLEFSLDEKILDYGCARGYLVRAFLSLGYNSCGFDISPWAIENCDKNVDGWVTNNWADIPKCTWTIAKDVLEHVPHEDLRLTISKIAEKTEKGIFVVVPLSYTNDTSYVVPEYEQDVTHIVRWTLRHWNKLFFDVLGDRWEVDSSYRIDGVKDNYYKDFPYGNGFITARKVR